MRWNPAARPERAMASALVTRAVPAAAAPLPFEDRLFEAHFKALLEAAATRGGIEAWLAALAEKSRRISLALAERRYPDVFALVFSARRRLGALAHDPAMEAAFDAFLASSHDAPETRIACFAEAVPVPQGEGLVVRREVAKRRRSAHDLAAELLRFGLSGDTPLMTRWVWDPATMSGALREFVRGADTLRELPLAADAATFAAARDWIAERVSGQGIYRDVPAWADCVLASAYGQYFRAMTGGVLGADFQRAADPADAITGLLGIDRLLGS